MIITGDIKINLLDIELLTIKLRLLVASVDKAKAIGIDWWEHDPACPARRRTENALRHRVSDAGNPPTMPASRRTIHRPPSVHLLGVRGVDRTAIQLVHHGELVAVVGTLSFSRGRRRCTARQTRNPGGAGGDRVGPSRCRHRDFRAQRHAAVPAGDDRPERTTGGRVAAHRPRAVPQCTRSARRPRAEVRRRRSTATSSRRCRRRPEAATAPHSDGSADAGRHYLRRRRQQLHDRDDARRSIAAAAAGIGDTLARLSVDHRHHRPQDPACPA